MTEASLVDQGKGHFEVILEETCRQGLPLPFLTSQYKSGAKFFGPLRTTKSYQRS